MGTFLLLLYFIFQKQPRSGDNICNKKHSSKLELPEQFVAQMSEVAALGCDKT